MAYDQNSIPKDLRPLNIMRNMPEEQRISPANSSGRPVEGYYASPPTDGSPGTIPTVYYPATIQDSGFVPLGINNGVTRVAGWVQQIAPPPQIQKGVSAAAAAGQGGGKYTTTSPSYDHTSDEGCGGGDDAVSTSSCRKVKFLCSFGGKILPRLSDGALRYVGGQTRIINIGTDILFGDFVRKMAETYVENVVIKYQLPEEDLDALVSVSCSDDLDNMMDEYDKLTERCSDGSSFAKLRIFLFSPSDLDSIGDLHDSGQKYVEAVNGIGDAFTATNNYTDCIARNESIESTVSTQNSDLSGDSLTHGVGEIISLPCNSNNNGFSHRGPKIINYVDSNPLPYAESCAVPLMVKTSPSASLGAVVEQQEVERSVPLSIPQASAAVMSYPASASPFMQTYADSHQESLNNASNYVQIPPQMGFPTQILGTVRQVFTQQAAPPPQQYMTMNPSFISMRPNVVPAVVQSSVRVENYPTETAVMPPRVVQGYNMNPSSNQGSRYGWPTEECQVCQKASPNAHSEEKGSPSSTISDASSVSGKIQGEGQSVYKVETPESSKTVPQGVVHLPYGVFVASNNPASSQNLVLQPQPQPQTQTQLQPMPLSNDFGSAVGMVVQKEQAPMEYYSSKVDDSIPSMAYESVRQVEVKLDSMRINSSEVVYTSTADNVSGSSANSDAESSREAERIFNEWNDSLVWSQPRISTGERDGNEGLVPSSSSHGVGDILDHLSSQFINYPPPRPSKLQTKRENADPLVENRPFSSGETPSVVENSMDEYGTYQLSRSLNWDISPDCSLSNKGSVEEQMKKEVQEAAEGVAAAASALHFSVSSSNEPMVNPGNDSPQESHQSRGSQSTNVETEQKRDTFDEIRNRLSERINFGLPASSIGRLQIIKNNDLEELRELGSGTFGTVYHGKWRGTDVAIKRINDRCFSGKPSEQERMRDDFWNEAIKLADLHHPNVVAFYGVVLDGPDGSVATVTEYMVNGSLRNALQRNDRILDKRKRLMIGMDVAFGMEYLHGKNIVHFDLKSDNLLVNLRDPHRPICKVGDLGLSKVKCQTLISGGVRGTLPWMAPELLNGSSSLVSEKVDVFSFGIVMWELVTGEEPYADLHYGAIIGGIVSNTLRPPVADGCDSDWRSLMERCWSSEPSERPNFTIIADELRAMAFKLQAKPQHSPNSQPKS